MGAMSFVKFLVLVVIFFMAVSALPELLTGAGASVWILIGVILIALVLSGQMNINKNLFFGFFVTMLVVFLSYGAMTRTWEELKTKPDGWARMARNAKQAWDDMSLADKLSLGCLFVSNPAAGDACSRYGAGSVGQAEEARENRIECLFDAARAAQVDQPILDTCRVHQADRRQLEICIETELGKRDITPSCYFGRGVAQPP